MKTQLKKWGNSLAIRVPRQALSQARLRHGDELEVTVLRRGTLRIRRSKGTPTLAQLVRGITRKNRHRETAWGAARGGEAW